MKIAHVVSTFWPRFGGMGEVCFEEAKRLAGHGNQVTVFTLLYPALAEKEVKDGVAVERVKPLIRLGDGGWAPELADRLAGFDLIHLHYPFYGGAEWVARAKNKLKAKLVVTYHMDAVPEGFVKKFFRLIYDTFVPARIFSTADKVIAVDAEHFSLSRFNKKIPDEKLAVIPNGVDIDIFKPAPADLAALGLERLSGKKIILFVGNLMPVKRLDLLIEALRIANDPKLAIVVVGGGYDEKNYHRIAQEQKLNDKVVFAGSCQDAKKLAAYYNAADCTAVPSDRESFSLSALYALSCGTPVIASDIPGLRGRVSEGEDGFLFKPGSAENLAGVIKKFFELSPEQRRQMGERGREKAAQYSWDKHMATLENIYNNVSNPKHPPASQARALRAGEAPASPRFSKAGKIRNKSKIRN